MMKIMRTTETQPRRPCESPKEKKPKINNQMASDKIEMVGKRGSQTAPKTKRNENSGKKKQ